MPLSELLPASDGLGRADKLLAIQLLAADFAREDGDVLAPSEAAYPIWSPYDAFEGAATLMRLLDDSTKRDSRNKLGQTAAGRYLQVIYVPDEDPESVFVITAYELRGKAKTAYRRRQRRNPR
jgi:hypothetical protein